MSWIYKFCLRYINKKYNNYWLLVFDSNNILIGEIRFCGRNQSLSCKKRQQSWANRSFFRKYKDPRGKHSLLKQTTVSLDIEECDGKMSKNKQKKHANHLDQQTAKYLRFCGHWEIHTSKNSVSFRSFQDFLTLLNSKLQSDPFSWHQCNKATFWLALRGLTLQLAKLSWGTDQIYINCIMAIPSLMTCIINVIGFTSYPTGKASQVIWPA